jgi:hypothetical protein
MKAYNLASTTKIKVPLSAQNLFRKVHLNAKIVK